MGCALPVCSWLTGLLQLPLLLFPGKATPDELQIRSTRQTDTCYGLACVCVWGVKNCGALHFDWPGLGIVDCCGSRGTGAERPVDRLYERLVHFSSAVRRFLTTSVWQCEPCKLKFWASCLLYTAKRCRNSCRFSVHPPLNGLHCLIMSYPRYRHPPPTLVLCFDALLVGWLAGCPQTFAIMTALGFFAGVCFLPVMFSILGPSSQSIQKARLPCHTHDMVDCTVALFFFWVNMQSIIVVCVSSNTAVL